MQTFSQRLRYLNPDMIFTFASGSTNVEFDLSKPYGIDYDLTYVGSETTDDILLPYFVQPASDFTSFDTDIVANQITINELYNEVDNSLVIGRTKSNLSGLVYKFNKPGANQNFVTSEQNAEIVEGGSTTFFWQLRFGPHSRLNPSIIHNYEAEDSNDYIVICLDDEHIDKSFAISNEITFGDGVEYWTNTFNPYKVVDGDIITPEFDTRYVTIAVINPRSGEIYDSYQLFFHRNGELKSGVHGEVITGSGDVDPFVGVYETYQATDVTRDWSKPRIKSIIMNDDFNLYIKRDDSMWHPTVPAGRITVEVDVPKRPVRSYNVEPLNTPANEFIQFMTIAGVRLQHNAYSNTIRFVNGFTGTVVGTLSAEVDKTYLYSMKVLYSFNPGHDPKNKKYDYNINYTIKYGDGNNTMSFSVRYQKENMVKVKHRGTTGNSFDMLPHALNLPLTFGFMASTAKIKSKKTMSARVGNSRIDVDVPYEATFVSMQNYAYIDNVCYFKDPTKFDEFYDLYYRSFEQKRLSIDNNMINHWACDTMGADFRTIPNKYNYTNNWYEVYSDMKIGGPGKITHEQEYHRIITDSMKFEDVTGIVKLMNTWNNSNKYTINFWIKTNQQEGVLLSDYEHETVNPKGIFLTLYQGMLQVKYSNTATKLLNAAYIADNEWHMITITSSSSNAGVTVYFDGQKIYAYTDAGNAAMGNKNYGLNPQVYFMGHPMFGHTNGNISRISFYSTAISEDNIKRMFIGDLEHIIQGTILKRNMPLETDVRFYHSRTGELVSIVRSDKETGRFLYRNYEDFSVYIMVVDFEQKFGNMQTVGPVVPVGIE